MPLCVPTPWNPECCLHRQVEFSVFIFLHLLITCHRVLVIASLKHTFYFSFRNPFALGFPLTILATPSQGSLLVLLFFSDCWCKCARAQCLDLLFKLTRQAYQFFQLLRPKVFESLLSSFFLSYYIANPWANFIGAISKIYLDFNHSVHTSTIPRQATIIL